MWLDVGTDCSGHLTGTSSSVTCDSKQLSGRMHTVAWIDGASGHPHVSSVWHQGQRRRGKLWWAAAALDKGGAWERGSDVQGTALEVPWRGMRCGESLMRSTWQGDLSPPWSLEGYGALIPQTFMNTGPSCYTAHTIRTAHFWRVAHISPRRGHGA